MRFARAALILTTTLLCAAADRVPTELFPPRTHMVVGLSLRTFLESPLMQAAGGSAAFPAVPFGGIDLKDLDSLIIASEGGTSDAPSIAVVRGRFHLDPAKAVRHGGIAVFQDRKGALALLDDNTALGGTLAEVKAAIDRRGGAPVISSELAARIDAVSSNDIWAVGDIPPGTRPKNPQAKGMDSVERFDFGASLRNGLQLRGSVRLRSAEDAAQLSAMVKMFSGMFQTEAANSPTKFDFRVDGRTISLDLSVPESELKKTVSSQRSLLAGMLQGGMPTGFTAVAPPQMASRPAPTAARAAAPSTPGSVVLDRGPLSWAPSEPATVVSNERGETVQLKLPGAK